MELSYLILCSDKNVVFRNKFKKKKSGGLWSKQIIESSDLFSFQHIGKSFSHLITYFQHLHGS